MPRTMTATTMTATTATRPTTGTDFRRLRLLALHASANEVASHLGVSNHTLIAWERSEAPVSEPRRSEWQRALALSAAARRTRLAHEGVADHEIQDTDFGRAYVALTTTSSTATPEGATHHAR